jgi:hypothetical protein
MLHGATLPQSGANSYMLSAMDRNITPLERAFQLAKSGAYSSVPAIKEQLKAEGLSIETITGKTLTKQLNVLIKAAQEQRYA